MMENKRIFPRTQLDGKIVKLRMGEYAVVLNGDLLNEHGYISSVLYYDNNLKKISTGEVSDHDIIGVYDVNTIYGGSIISRLKGEGLTLLWEEDNWHDHIGDKVVVKDHMLAQPRNGYLHDYVPDDVFPFKVLISPGDEFLGVKPTVKSYSICELYKVE